MLSLHCVVHGQGIQDIYNISVGHFLWQSVVLIWARLMQIFKVKEDLTHFVLETPKGVLAKSGDPDQMPHNVASDLSLHYFASFSAIFQQKYIN